MSFQKRLGGNQGWLQYNICVNSIYFPISTGSQHKKRHRIEIFQYLYVIFQIETLKGIVR